MKIRKIFIISFLLFIGCEKYDDYLVDYKFSAVYFATQKPLRTIVSYEEMKFKVGVALGGKRTNDNNEYAEFTIDPSLLNDENLTDGNDFELMPSTYYSLSNDNRMDIPAGKFIGDITVSLNKEAFTSDQASTKNFYAIPLRITKTSTDTILEQKDYTIVVVKYISQYHGTYYHKGVQIEVDSSGTILGQTVYSDKDLIKNETWNVETEDALTVTTPAAGTFGNGKLILNVDKNSSNVTIASGNQNIEITDNSGVYNPDDRAFYLKYDFIRDQKMYQVSDTLILRQPPEKDLYFEEW